MPRPGSSRSWTGFALIAIAVAAAILPLPAAFVERWYSQTFYPKLQWGLTPITNLVPIALLDPAAAGLIVFAISRAGRGLQGVRSAAGVRRVLTAVAVFVAGSYLAFLFLWGLNYRRVPLEEKLEFDRARVTRDAALTLGKEAVARVNELHGRLQSDWRNARGLDAAFEDAQLLLGSRWTAALGRPKWSLLTYYFRWAAIDGMTDPFFLEIIVNPDVLPFERPFVVAHEWSHLAGYADESEANFVAWLTCIRGDSVARYSGWLALYGHLSAALPRDDRRALFAALEPGPRADLAATAARYERSAPVVRQAAREVYDSYLKANRVSEGIASYDAVVNLAVGTAFAGEWTPRLRTDRPNKGASQ